MKGFAVWATIDPLLHRNYQAIMYSIHDIERSYSHIVTDYVDSLYSYHWSRKFEYPWVIKQISTVEDLKQKTILDLGGGVTPIQFILSGYVKEYINIDINPAVNKQIEQVNKESSLYNNIIVLNIDIGKKLPFENDSFDIVMSISAIEHVIAPLNVQVDEMLRVLKPGGKLILTIDVTDIRNGIFNVNREIFENLCRYLKIDVPPREMNILHSMQTLDGYIVSPFLDVNVNDGTTEEPVREQIVVPIYIGCIVLVK